MDATNPKSKKMLKKSSKLEPEFCDNINRDDQNLNLKNINEPRSKNHQCPICDKRFFKVSNFKSHLLCHEKIKRFPCQAPGCKIICKRKKALNSHMQIHSHSDYGFLCSFCGDKFASLSGLKSHQVHHTGQSYIARNVKCNICGKMFKCQSDLSIHSVVHSNIKGFSCDLCSQEFKQKASLKEHKAVHENLFQCYNCKKSFGRKRYLDQHQKICKQLSKEKGEEIDVDLVVSDKSDSIVYQLEDGSQTCVFLQVGQPETNLTGGEDKVIFIEQSLASSGIDTVSQHDREGALAMLEFREQFRA